MKKNILKLSVLAFIGVSIWACNKEEVTPVESSNLEQPYMVEQNIRQQLINGDLLFQDLNKQQKIDVTIEKLNQILTDNNLDPSVELLISDLYTEIPKYYNSESNTVSSIGVQLANIIPEDDFLDMFFRFENYVNGGGYYGVESVSQDIKDKIVSLLYNGGIIIEKPKKQLYCDCNWTCGYLNTDCIKTIDGCGFFWQYPCEYIDL